MTSDLFADEAREVALAPGAMLLSGFARPMEGPLLSAMERVAEAAPFRHMSTPGGHRMSVAMTNCGATGWVTDRSGYRYDPRDPESGRPWPAMPGAFADLAARAAERAGFQAFAPDACLINRYAPGARLSLHQDRNERDFDAPIVSVSLGLPAVFLFGGLDRADRPRRLRLSHGDVVVWGGPSRLRYHGVLPLEEGHHPLTGGHRINLTFRKASALRWPEDGAAPFESQAVSESEKISRPTTRSDLSGAGDFRRPGSEDPPRGGRRHPARERR